MLICWSVKGGSGTSVVAALLALAACRNGTQKVQVLDWGTDQAAIFGARDSAKPGFRQWLSAGPDVPDAALGQLGCSVAKGVSVIPGGLAGPPSGSHERPDSLSDAKRLTYALRGYVTIADGGVFGDPLLSSLIETGHPSVLVTRLCYLSVRRASALDVRPSGIIVIEEPGRSLTSGDVSDVLGVPILGTVPWDQSLARAVDAGRLDGKPFRSARDLDRVAHRYLGGVTNVA